MTEKTEKKLSERALSVIVWGTQHRKEVPKDYKAEKNFDASNLGYAKYGVKWNLDGRTENIQKAVVNQPGFQPFMDAIVNTIEKENLKCISINCLKGKHRSVTVAVMLKEKYYPNATLTFLELKD